MKTISIFALLMLAAVFAYGQKQKIDEVKVTPPKFTGVANAFSTSKDGHFESINDYLAKNIQYPEEDVKSFKQGTEVVQFIVSPTGELTDFTIVNGVSQQINEEVIRVLQTTNGMWFPGYNNGNPVAMEKEVSVVFKIEGFRFSTDFKTLATNYFSKGSELFLEKQNPKKALKYYDKGIVLLPNDKGLLLMRGFARYETGNKEGATRDWQRITTLGHSFNSEYLGNLAGLNGFEEFANVLSK
ncbi:energy transducer TonB [Mariniphaga sp.]|uniref:energy transducer TonB n=1 Tax=Mariniphaga sp. TaxID=1954475 RepID=UPI003566272B